MASIPLPDHSYKYRPVYGVEEFDVANLGAKVTQENLLISAWRTPDVAVPGAQPVDFAEILTPDALTDELPFTNANRNGFIGTMKSRYSCRFWFESTDAQPKFGSNFSVVLNPPAELKQQIMQAAKYVGNAATPFSAGELPDYQFSKSVMYDYSWLVRADEGATFGDVPEVPDGSHSVFVPFDEGGSPFYPYLRTSGADGNAPEFYDVTSAAAVRDMIAAIDAGEDFFVFMTFDTTIFDSGPAKNLDILWPHSIARG
jgi:hypothetical protein